MLPKSGWFIKGRDNEFLQFGRLESLRSWGPQRDPLSERKEKERTEEGRKDVTKERREKRDKFILLP